MSDQNGAAATAPAPAAKTFTQEDIERERAHAQHFKQIADELQNKYKGIDIEDYNKTKAELAETRKKAALGDPKAMDEWKAQTEAEIRKQVQKELDEAKTIANKYQGENKELRVTDTVFNVAASEVEDGAGEDVKAIIRKHGEINEKGEIIFKDENGKPLNAPGSVTEAMNAQQFVQWMREKKPYLFKAKEIPGTKQPGQKVNPASLGIKSLADLQRLPDKGKELLRQNPSLATQLLSRAKI